MAEFWIERTAINNCSVFKHENCQFDQFIITNCKKNVTLKTYFGGCWIYFMGCRDLSSCSIHVFYMFDIWFSIKIAWFNEAAEVNTLKITDVCTLKMQMLSAYMCKFDFKIYLTNCVLRKRASCSLLLLLLFPINECNLKFKDVFCISKCFSYVSEHGTTPPCAHYDPKFKFWFGKYFEKYFHKKRANKIT